MNKYYVTAAIPYVNGDPHIGHALEFVQADAIARYHRLMKDDTCYLSGADENALKNVQAAEKANLGVQEFCDIKAARFKELFASLNTSLDIFQRSSSKKLHYPGSKLLWELCQRNGDIYKKKYKGLYCVGCESFKTEKELVNGLCPEHLKKPEEVEEENYFFKLSKYQDQLLELIESDKLKIIPEKRKNEIVSFIKMGLEDFSISRSQERAKNWGIPVPGDPSQIMYVWFDALNVYQTGVGFGINEAEYQKWWPADVHTIGKGIIRFHAVYWPAILLSAGLKLPKELFVHGYITSGGQKMSKSLGNVIDPFEELRTYGTDPVRYYLLSQIPATEDGDYTKELFVKTYNSDLANGLGNVISRVATLCGKSGLQFESSKTEFKDLESDHEYHKLWHQFRFNEIMFYIWQKIKKLDQTINFDEPWKLLKNNDPKLKTVLNHYVLEIRKIACLLEPFLPETSEKIKRQYNQKEIKAQEPLFPRIS